EFVRLLAEELRAIKDDLGRLVTLETGKIVSEGLGDGPGDDRYLRLCRRVVAAALRPHHRDRAHRPPDDGDLASAWRLWRHLCFQLPGGGVVLECGSRFRLRRPGGVEAIREDSAHDAGHTGDRRARDAAIWQRARRPLRGGDRRPRYWPSSRRRRPSSGG